MAYTVKITEGDPAERPTISGAPDGVDAVAVWQRLESWLAWRWGSRSVEYIAEGPGEWSAPLAPSTIATTEVWNGAAWEAATLAASPLGGYVLEGQGPYRFAGTVGAAGDPPAAVAAAWLRLAEYFATAADWTAGETRTALTIGDNLREERERPAGWMPKALVYSGAADLLRPWRRP